MSTSLLLGKRLVSAPSMVLIPSRPFLTAVKQRLARWESEVNWEAGFHPHGTPAQREHYQIFKKTFDAGPQWRRWGAICTTPTFKKAMTKFYVAMYAIAIFFFYRHMTTEMGHEQELKALGVKMNAGDALSEYESLRWRVLTQQPLRTRDSLKMEQYDLLRAEYDEQVKKNPTLPPFSPQASDITVVQHPSAVVKLSDSDPNNAILPARDTTEFYDGKAETFDEDIKWEERFAMIGRRRAWAMGKVCGDVLEVACGTGRNIPYLDVSKVDSITFLDSSAKMVEIAHQKFREEYPKSKKCAFVVGRAEELMEISGNTPAHPIVITEISAQTTVQSTADIPAHTITEPVTVTPVSSIPVEPSTTEVTTAGSVIAASPESSRGVKYDTILETFGICSHENPIKALQNMAALLKPDGRIVLVEHGRGTWDFVNRHLDKRAEHRLDEWGCRWNLDIGEVVDDSGLEVVEESRHDFGTTWCFVLKPKGAPKKASEKRFGEKYLNLTKV